MAGIERGRGREREVAGGELREVRVGDNRSYKALGVTVVTVSGLGSNMNDPKWNTLISDSFSRTSTGELSPSHSRKCIIPSLSAVPPFSLGVRTPPYFSRPTCH